MTALRAALLIILFCAPGNFLLARKPLARKHQTLVSQVSPHSLTIVEDNGPRTFELTPFTEIYVNDQKAAVAQLKKGMRVSVTLEDPTHLRQIKAWNAD